MLTNTLVLMSVIFEDLAYYFSLAIIAVALMAFVLWLAFLMYAVGSIL